MPGDAEYVRVEVMGVRQDPYSNAVVVLRDSRGRQLSIWIGTCEAIAIHQRTNAEFDPPRPLAQDLMIALWRRLGGQLKELRIDDLWQDVYYSKLTVEQNGQTVAVDCRPSDGLAVALAAGVPIFVADHVMPNSEDH
ncbi:MAG: bifunctional nuclease family protein [Armatimonadetes bacterium]|nr:bifunctional nuclease family protein [Armatimonadota bacterium]